MANKEKVEVSDNRTLFARVKDLETANATLKKLIQRQSESLELLEVELGLLRMKIGE